MAENTKIYLGELNRKVELFAVQKGVNSAGEQLGDTLISLGRKWVKRLDRSGSQDRDGRLVEISLVDFVMRYSASLLSEGARYMLRDSDGDYYGFHVSLYGEQRQRNRLIRIRTEKREA